MFFARGSLLQRKLIFQPLCFRCYAARNVIIMFMIVIYHIKYGSTYDNDTNSSEKVLLTQTTHVWYIYLRTFTIKDKPNVGKYTLITWMILVIHIYKYLSSK